MKLDKRDVEAVARARVNRVEVKRTNYWIIGVIVATMAGWVLAQTSAALGIVIFVGAIVAFTWYMNTLSKKQKATTSHLLREWEQEQVKK